MGSLDASQRKTTSRPTSGTITSFCPLAWSTYLSDPQRHPRASWPANRVELPLPTRRCNRKEQRNGLLRDQLRLRFLIRRRGPVLALSGHGNRLWGMSRAQSRHFDHGHSMSADDPIRALKSRALLVRARLSLQAVFRVLGFSRDPFRRRP